MNQEGQQRQTIDPHYKGGNVFERDQAYYSQMLTGTRRTTGNLQSGMRQSSLQRSNANNPQGSRLSPAYNQTSIVSQPYNANSLSQAPNPSLGSNHMGSTLLNNREYSEAYQANLTLKGELDGLINGGTDFGLSTNVVKLSHYNLSQADMLKIKEQEDEIRRLEQAVDHNNGRIEGYKRAVEELSGRMGNIQSIDKEIYKTLQGAVNRDRDLLERASTALARGERREDVARVLQQIIM